MKHLILPILLLLYVIVNAQDANINYDTQIKELETGEIFAFTKSYTFLNTEQSNKIIDSYLNYIFSKDSFEVYESLGENITLISDILENGKNQNSYANKYFKKDDIIYKAEYGGNKYYINRKGQFAPDTVFVEDYETGEIISNVIFNADMYSRVGGLYFAENWEYADSKFYKISLGQGFVTYENSWNDLQESSYLRKHLEGVFLNENTNSDKMELLAKDMIYDVRIVPVGEFSSCTSSELYGMYYKDSYQKNNIIIGLLNDIKLGRIKAYKVEDDSIQKTSLDFITVKEILSKTTTSYECTDISKLRKYQEMKITPKVEEYNQYKLDEWGEVEYPEYNDYMPILISTRIDTIGYDTIWRYKNDYLDKDVKTDTLITYQYSDWGDYIEAYDENGNMYYLSDTIYNTDTIWNLKPEILEQVNKETQGTLKFDVIHDKLKNITDLRFYEDWYIDPNSFIITKKVKGIGIIIGALNYPFDEFGENYQFEPDFFFKEYKLYIELN